MADNTRNIIGIAMDLDVTDLKAGLQESRKQISTANKQFAAATSGMDDWSKSSEGLNAKLEQLDTILKSQKKNVAGIEAELKRSARQYGENSEQVRRLKDQLLDAQAAVGKTEKAQRKYTNALQNLETQERETANETRNLNDSLRDTGSATEVLRGGFTVLKGALAGLVTVGITSFVSGLKSAIEETREFRREIAYLEQGAEAAGVSFDKAKEKVKEVTAITQDQGAAVEGLNNLMTAGFNGDALNDVTDLITGAAIKWKDTLKFEGLSDSLQEWIGSKGASLTGNFAELLERMGYNLEEVTAKTAGMTDEQRRAYAVNLLSSEGLKEVTEGYREANKSLIEGEEANFAYADAMARVSEKVEPIFTAFKQGWAGVLNAFLTSSSGMNLEGFKNGIQNAFQFFIDEVIPIVTDFANFFKENKDSIVEFFEPVGAAISEAFTWFKEEGVPAIKNGLQFILDNKEAVLTAIVGIGSAFAAWKIGSILQAARVGFLQFIAGANGSNIAMKVLNATMRANPIGFILTLISLLVTGFMTLWNTSEEFRGFWIGLWEGIKAAVQPVIDFLAPIFSNIWEGIQEVWSGAVEWFTGIFEGIKSIFEPTEDAVASPFSKAVELIKLYWDSVVGYFELIWENIKAVFSVVTDVLSGDFEGAWNGIKGIWDNVVEYFTGIFDGIKSIFAPEKTNEAIANPFSGALDTIKGAWEGVKDWFGGIFDGIKKAVAPIDKALGSPFSNAWENIKVVWDLAKGYFQLIWNNIKLIFSVVKDVLSGDFKAAWEGIKKIWDNSTSYFSDLVDEIFSYFAELPNNLIQVGRDMIDGIKSGITEKAESLARSVADAAKAALDRAKNALGIHSPSTKARDEVGIPFGQGIGVGILDSIKYVTKDIGKFNNMLVDKASDIQAGLTLPIANSNGVFGNQAASNNVVNNNSYTQVINAPKQPSRIELYRQTKNLLALRGGYNV